MEFSRVAYKPWAPLFIRTIFILVSFFIVLRFFLLNFVQNKLIFFKLIDQFSLYFIYFPFVALNCAVFVNVVFLCVNVEDAKVFRSCLINV